MIKAIDEIPQNKAQKQNSYRERIREDIQEALDKGIYKFEFVGDYNFKTLQNTAREEADKIVRKIEYSWWKEHPEYKEQLKWSPFSWSDNKKFKLISITSVKCEIPQERRVFCEIKQDMESVFMVIVENEIKRIHEKENNNE